MSFVSTASEQRASRGTAAGATTPGQAQGHQAPSAGSGPLPSAADDPVGPAYAGRDMPALASKPEHATHAHYGTHRSMDHYGTLRSTGHYDGQGHGQGLGQGHGQGQRHVDHYGTHRSADMHYGTHRPAHGHAGHADHYGTHRSADHYGTHRSAHGAGAAYGGSHGGGHGGAHAHAHGQANAYGTMPAQAQHAAHTGHYGAQSQSQYGVHRSAGDLQQQQQQQQPPLLQHGVVHRSGDTAYYGTHRSRYAITEL